MSLWRSTRLTAHFCGNQPTPNYRQVRVNDWPQQGICSTPFIEGDRLYYISNRCEVVCIDTEGFTDGENDGPFTDETDATEIDGDIVWKYDMIEELDVFPHNLATCSPVGAGDLLFVITANGVDEGHIHIPSPFAPSFIAVNKDTGELVWESDVPGENILHGQWSNPAYAEINGVPQVILPGGDGWVYSLEPETGNLIWKFDGNPKDSVWELGGKRNPKRYNCYSCNLQQQGLYRCWSRPGTWRGSRTPLGD